MSPLYRSPDSSCAGMKAVSDKALTRKTLLFCAVFALERCYSASIVKVNRLVSDKFSYRSSAQCERTPPWHKTIHIQDQSSAASLRHKNCTKIIVLYVNKHPFRYGFRAGARAIRYSVKALFQSWAISLFIPGRSIFQVGMITGIVDMASVSEPSI